MGLDITAYSRLTAVGKHVEDWCEEDDHVHAFSYDSFPQSFRGIPILGTDYFPDGSAFLEGGCYAVTDNTETHGFRAGSYGGYNVWRANLQEQFNPDRHPDGPFYELIWFADSEGTIGPEAARDLLADFQELADPDVVPAGWPNRFSDWTRAFELAAADGLVRFH